MAINNYKLNEMKKLDNKDLKFLRELIDDLGLELTNHDHKWSNLLRKRYEKSLKIIDPKILNAKIKDIYGNQLGKTVFLPKGGE